MCRNKKSVGRVSNHAKNGIISKINLKSKRIFCTLGFGNKAVLEGIGVDYILINDECDSLQMLKGLNDKEVFFISNNELSFIWIKKEFASLGAKAYFLDMEILKALALIPKKERILNRCVIGIDLPISYSLKGFYKEIIQSQGYTKKQGLEVLKALLETMIQSIKKG